MRCVRHAGRGVLGGGRAETPREERARPSLQRAALFRTRANGLCYPCYEYIIPKLLAASSASSRRLPVRFRYPVLVAGQSRPVFGRSGRRSGIGRHRVGRNRVRLRCNGLWQRQWGRLRHEFRFESQRCVDGQPSGTRRGGSQEEEGARSPRQRQRLEHGCRRGRRRHLGHVNLGRHGLGHIDGRRHVRIGHDRIGFGCHGFRDVRLGRVGFGHQRFGNRRHGSQVNRTECASTVSPKRRAGMPPARRFVFRVSLGLGPETDAE